MMVVSVDEALVSGEESGNIGLVEVGLKGSIKGLSGGMETSRFCWRGQWIQRGCSMAKRAGFGPLEDSIKVEPGWYHGWQVRTMGAELVIRTMGAELV
ncbi:hypothetical protein GQ457_16G021150 [Hibiscus cannabinus]